MSSAVARDSFTPLEVSVPDRFELDLGCDPDCRYLGFFPDHFGTHLVSDNGELQEVIDESVWEAWLAAPQVRARIEQAMTDDWSFLLDTRSRRLYRGNEGETREFLYRDRLATRCGSAR